MKLEEAFNRNYEKMVKREPTRLEEILTWSTSSLSSTWQWKQTLVEGLTAVVLGSLKMNGKCDLGQLRMILSTGPALRPTYKDSPLV